MILAETMRAGPRETGTFIRDSGDFAKGPTTVGESRPCGLEMNKERKILPEDVRCVWVKYIFFCCRGTAYASGSHSLRRPLQCSIIMQLRKGYDAANSPCLHLACRTRLRQTDVTAHFRI
jgi:hypothetical protein